MTILQRGHDPTAPDADASGVGSGRRAVDGNVPAELSSFVGRHRELREVKRLMTTTRLVTLIGIGGVGKTRLAQRVATEIRRAFPDGTWFAGLAESRDGGPEPRDADLLAQVVGTALGLRGQVGLRPLDALSGYFAGRRALLVLDNCEHLSAAVAVLADALLRRCPELRIIATSREPLAVPGETVFPVPPLPTPASSAAHNGQALETESVALFVDRAATASPGFRATTENGAVIAGICDRLDGLPLAIELAAAWLPVLAPQQILDRLDDRFALLSRGNRTAPDRQQTLRASIDWSYDLCTPAEQRLWARLSVFAGAFELDAVEGICTDEQVPLADVLDLITGLLDKSVLLRDGWGLVARYRMLETVRAYAQERLRGHGGDQWLRRRHRDWYERLAARAYQEWISPRQSYWLSRLEREHTNIRSAVEYCLTTPGEADRALHIAASFPPLYWAARGLLPDTRRWLHQALARSTARDESRLRALTTATVLAALHGDEPATAALVRQARELAERIDTDLARGLYEHARAAGALAGGSPTRSVVAYLSALAAFRDAGDIQMQLRTLNRLGLACALAGDTVLAAASCEEVLRVTEATGEVWHRCVALNILGIARWLQNDLLNAAKVLRQGLELRRLLDDPLGTAWCLETLAWIAARERDATRAAVLFGAARGLSEAVGAPTPTHPSVAPEHDKWERHARDALRGTAFDTAYRQGMGLTAGAAIDFALATHLEPGPAAAPGDPDAAALTRREREVSELIAAGLTNKEIAARLVISRRTAESHVEHILAKLGFSSRSQVAAWAARRPPTRG